MELIKDTPFEAGWVVWRARPNAPCITVVIKGTFTAVESGECPIDPDQALPTGDEYHDDDPERSVRYESDFAFVKPKGECFLYGSCYAPGGRPTTTALAAFKVGSVVKKIAVIGDRQFKGFLRGKTEPEPFEQMPLCWERAFGGPRLDDNPVGSGMSKSVVDGKSVIRLPNIEDPDNLMQGKRSRPSPTGVFPIPRTWKSRMKLTGTYDARWQKTRWPWFPEDFQWSYFNAAPPDQQITGYFKGDEQISLLNLHPSIQKLYCQLPSLRATAFLVEQETGFLKSVTPDLDTITIDTDAGKIHCVWRGVTEVPSEALDEYSHLFVVHEKLNERRTDDEYRAWFERAAGIEAEEEEAFEPEPVPGPEAPAVAADIPPAGLPGAFEAAPAPLPVVVPGAGGGSGGESMFPGFEELEQPARKGPSALPEPVPLDSPVMAPALSAAEEQALMADAELGGGDGEATEMLSADAVTAFMASEASELVDANALSALFSDGEATEMMDPAAITDFLDAQTGDLEAGLAPDSGLDAESTAMLDPAMFDEYVHEESTSLLSAQSLAAAVDSGDLPALDGPDEAAATPQAELGSSAAFLQNITAADVRAALPSAAAEESPAGEFGPPGELPAAGSTESTFGMPAELPPEPGAAVPERAVEAPAEPGGDVAKTALFDPKFRLPTAAGGDRSTALYDEDIHGATGAVTDRKTALYDEEAHGAQAEPPEAPAAEPPEAPAAEPPPATPDGPAPPPMVTADVAPPPAAPIEPVPVTHSPDEAVAPQWAGNLAEPPPVAEEPPAEEERPAEELTAEQREQRAKVEAAVAGGESCEGWDLTGAQLAGLNLAGANLEGAILTRANLAGVNLDGARLDNAVLLGADLTGASLQGTSMAGAMLAEVKAGKAVFLDVDLTGIVASDARLPQARLTACNCAGANLDGVDFRKALFTKVALDGSDLSGSRLDDAQFVDSSLVATDFGANTSAQRVNLGDCDLTGLRASEGVDFTRADFRGAKATKSRFQTAMLHFANFSMAELDDADFSDANLAQATLLGCTLRMARFDRSTAVGAVFGKSDLHQAKFEGANLHHADLRGCNLFQAEFLDAETQDAQLELAILTGTKLA